MNKQQKLKNTAGGLLAVLAAVCFESQCHQSRDRVRATATAFSGS